METMKRWAGVVAGFFLCTGIAQAAPPPAEAFFKDPAIVEAMLSPSGRKLAIRSSFGGNRIGLGVFDLSPGGKPTRTAQFNDGDIWRAHWVNDDRLVFSVVDLSDGSGRPRGAPGLFAINPDGSQMRQLVRRMGRPVITDGSRQERLLDWNHRLLTVPRPQAGQVNEEVLVVEFTPDQQQLETPLWLNTRTGRTRPTGVDIPSNTVGWVTDSRGELRVALTRREGRRGALWRGPGQQAWQPLFESDLLNPPFGINAVDDAGQLYVTRTQGPAGETVLGLYDFERRALASEPLVVTPGFDFSGRVLNDAAGAALGVRVVTDAESTIWRNAAMQALQKEADERLPGRVNSITCRRCGQPDMVALVRSYSDRDPGQFWLYQAQPPEGEENWRPVGRIRNDIKPSEMAQMDLQRIKARDGRDLPVWVTKSPNATGLPAIVLVHGGPWVRGNVWGWHAQAQFLASRGYVVIEPEFRGSAGYGREHFRASFKQFGQAMQDDVADALRWAQAQGLASDKACIAGGSYGGYSTLMGLINDPALYRCGVAWVAVTDLDLYVAGSWWVRDDIPDWGRQYQQRDMVGDPDKDAALIAAHSPVKQAARLKAPVMLVFGEADLRVPLAHGERMRKALREAGNEPVWVSYPGEGHGFAVLKNRVDFAERMEAFLDRHLKAAPAARAP
ncbi:acetyl esterase/lipase [Pelomonas saccharophila]|uniref:Acetyl esterase/lipase n=1 Tax=Roseateles saccharophilus TaxID=304 RepID=A0ABU1YQT5_ROSSA|nr:prolyl oligopeptidase family serine peptidase [Roseateles saccharophilus]MDR7271227.1 acetyl esterase/lipase [Roseateles saccharophilus]